MENISNEVGNKSETSNEASHEESCERTSDISNDISESKSAEGSNEDKVTSDNHTSPDYTNNMRNEVAKENNASSQIKNTTTTPSTEGFKKPTLLIGPRRGHIGKIRSVQNVASNKQLESDDTSNDMVSETTEEEVIVEAKLEEVKEARLTQSKPVGEPSKDIPLPYKEPLWSGLPDKKYELEVLKSGVILETIDLSKRSFHIVGRLPACDLSLAHPTISRYHAILQYRAVGDEKNAQGLYLYDLGSTHGTFWNGNRIRPNVYVRLRGGHMIRFGCSNRKYILQAPPEDQEDESELSVTELKEKRRLELEERERIEKERQMQEEEQERLQKEKEETVGIDWGMGEDADEESDLTENPYATTTNEELFLDDPKKTLRGWFEREGYDLQYQTEEKGVGQFLCWVNLPIEAVVGHPARAEALVKGKKKESVIQCALEACRILDRHGLLRQANHEARKRKSKNWEEQDYYDSDEDNFLDRTGSVEKKREKRMRQAGKLENKVETYNTLLEKHTEISKQIQDLESCLRKSERSKGSMSEEGDEDALDAFMSTLNSSALSKSEITRIKLELQNLRKEEERLIKLVNLTRPTDLPPLKPHVTALEKDSPEKTNKLGRASVCIGHMKKTKPPMKNAGINARNTVTNLECSKPELESDEEMDEDVDSINDKINNKEDDADENDIKVRKPECMENVIKSDDDSQMQNDSSKDVKCSAREADDKGTDETFKAEKLRAKQKARNKKKAEKAAKEAEKSYDQNVYGDNYSTWVPPRNQTGDGTTNLNAKYGY